MNPRLIYAAVIVVVVGGVLAFMAFRRPANNANFPEGTHWLCGDPKCATHYTLSVKELGEHHRKNFGKRPPCPKCGKEAFGAQQCVHCKKVYHQQRGMVHCPYCGKMQAAPPTPA